MHTEISAEGTDRAVKLLADGHPVALPTETVYGLAADATRPDAVLKIFEAKERPFFDPLIVHLPDLDWLDRITQNRDPLVQKLVEAFWPGPLTLVLPRREIIPDVVTSGLETVAVRMSAHPVFRKIVSQFGKPVAAPSANRFGRISPTTAQHVMSELEGRIPLIVDGGATLHGIESTILAVADGKVRLLRAGPVTPEEIADIWMKDRADRNDIPTEAAVTEFYLGLGLSFSRILSGARDARIEAPGQLKSHYAPRTPMRILTLGSHIRSDSENGLRMGCLAWDKPLPDGPFAVTEILSETGDMREAAATLFAKMRRLDEAGLDLIVAAEVPERGLGIAIMDRLRKASANG